MSAAVKKTLPSGLVIEDRARIITGALSGKRIKLHDNRFGYPLSTPHAGFGSNGAVSIGTNGNLSSEMEEKLSAIQALLPSPGNDPNMLNHKLQLGLFVPSTNTSMETELWSILKGSQKNAMLTDGIGIHNVNILTAKPKVGSTADVKAYRDQFLAGMRDALLTMKHVVCHHYIMGMSMEHIMSTYADVKKPMEDFEKDCDGIGLAAWHNAATAALHKFGARKIALLTPFDKSGQQSAVNVFTEMGFDVVRDFGFACATTLDIGHVPHQAKVKAITEVLDGENVDAIVQCGTNFSLLPVICEVEAKIGKPVLGINQTLLWYALREAGFEEKLENAGRLFAEH